MPRRLAMLAFAVAFSAQADTDRETLYQISTIDALLTGVLMVNGYCGGR